MTEAEALLTLNAIPGVGNGRVRRIFENFESPYQVFSCKAQDLADHLQISFNLAGKIAAFPADDFLKKEFDLIHQHGVRVLTCQDPDYPAILKEIPDYPVVLYIKGDIGENLPGLAIVGSRRATIYGRQTAEKFSMRLAEMGINIVSGLARGIDTAAHVGALKAGGTTWAVLGSGLANIYPAENKALAENICHKGMLVSEFPMTMPPHAFNFPRRNRIVSGLSLGVVVIEAAKRSGALITSRCALDQGREVFAVPGKVDSANAQGVHQLIKDGAKLVGCVEDILEEVVIPLRSRVEKTSTLKREGRPGLTPEEENVMGCFSGKPLYVDEIINKSHFSVAKLNDILLNLEMKHCLRSLPGKYFEKRSV